MLSIDYLASIKIYGKSSGKEKATFEKIKHLKKLSHLNVYTLDTISANENFKVIKMMFLELYYVFNVVFIKKSKPNLIISRTFFCFGALAISKIYKIPLIREVHSDFLNEGLVLYKGNYFKLLMCKLMHYYNLFFLKRASGLIFNNSLLEDYFKNNYLNNHVPTITIHNGCDTDFFYPIGKVEAKEIIRLQKDIIYLLFIGSVSRWHGVESIIGTFRYMKKMVPDKKIKLLVVGGINTDYLDNLKESFNDENVDFTGKVSKDKAFYYINAADVCLLPVNNIRISPGSPLKLFDYAACGKPIIAQENTIGYSDIIDKYNLGICCDFNNAQDAAEAVLQFLNDYDESYYLSNNREVAEKYFSWEIVLSRWIDFGLSLKN